MRRILLALLFIIPAAFALDVSSCSSGSVEWKCDLGKTCVCTIEGVCTDGNLLVYDKSLDNPLCSPSIIAGSVMINWGKCKNPEGIVSIRADCEEGQSDEKQITLLQPSQQSTTTYYTKKTTTTESQLEECLYECCINEPGVKNKPCSRGLTCCDNECKESCSSSGRSFKIIFLVLFLLVIICSGIYIFIKIRKQKREEELAESANRYYMG